MRLPLVEGVERLQKAQGRRLEEVGPEQRHLAEAWRLEAAASLLA